MYEKGSEKSDQELSIHWKIYIKIGDIPPMKNASFFMAHLARANKLNDIILKIRGIDENILILISTPIGLIHTVSRTSIHLPT